VSGLPAALWLLGLYAAAPALRAGPIYTFPDRLRDALVLGVAIPFALGFVHALYWGACWAGLLLCIAIAVWRSLNEGSAAEKTARPTPYLLIAALLLVAWPQLMRPLLDGDSLSYHLPNAAAWVHAHSLWTATTRYWWYPPASELFASALYAVASPFALPWCGFCALALLGFRIAAWSRDGLGLSVLSADALAAATVTAYPLAIQGGTLQNDVWLAAFWLETLWSFRALPPKHFSPSAAVTALIKPQGWIFAAIALLASRARPILWAGTFAVLGLWAIHDAALWKSAVESPAASVTGAGLYGSTILAHGARAFALLVTVAIHLSPFVLIALLAALLGPLIAMRDRALGWAAFASLALFLVLPFGYETSVAQLANGASLRFAAPAIAAGALLLAPLVRRAGITATVLLWISTLYGCWFVLAVFWNDGSTHVALAIAALGVAIAAAANRTQLRLVTAAAFLAGVVLATHLAARHPLDYYNDSLSVGGKSPGVYRWIERTQPAAVGGWGLRAGVVNVLSPRTQTLDLADTDPCARAREQGVLLVAVAQSDLPPDTNAQRLSAARACGRVLYADPIAAVEQPLGP
jgi:hypothetical protein